MRNTWPRDQYTGPGGGLYAGPGGGMYTGPGGGAYTGPGGGLYTGPGGGLYTGPGGGLYTGPGGGLYTGPEGGLYTGPGGGLPGGGLYTCTCRLLDPRFAPLNRNTVGRREHVRVECYLHVVTAREKLLRQVLSGRSDQNISFESLCELVRSFGFRERASGSYYVFGKDGVVEILNLQPLPSGKAKRDRSI